MKTNSLKTRNTAHKQLAAEIKKMRIRMMVSKDPEERRTLSAKINALRQLRNRVSGIQAAAFTDLCPKKLVEPENIEYL